MIKPKVSSYKKGAIFNVLWILIKNPSNHIRMRICDIQRDLREYFDIELNEKTIKDYVDILIELKLGIDIKHDTNKGYYIDNRLLTDMERDVLFNLVVKSKALSEVTFKNLISFINIDLSFENSKKYEDKHFSDNKSLALENLSLITKAIDENKLISFDFVTADRFGGYQKIGIRYETIPHEVRYINGNYFLYSKSKFWPDDYTGINLKYMRNIVIEYDKDYIVDLSYKRNNYTFELEVLYEWSIEYIKEQFDNFELIRTQSSITARITSPYDIALDWCRKYGYNFIIKDKMIKESLEKEYRNLIQHLNSPDIILLKIKASIVNFYYNNPMPKLNEYKEYFYKMINTIEYNFMNMGYTLMNDGNIRIFSKGNKKFAVCILDYYANKYKLNDNTLEKIEIDSEHEKAKINESINALNMQDADSKYLVTLTGYMKDSLLDKIFNLKPLKKRYRVIEAFPKNEDAFFNNLILYNLK